MKVDIRTLREGSNPLQFTIGADQANEIVKDMDELYRSDAPVEVDFDLSRTDRIIVLRGSVTLSYHFECARCLVDRARTLEIPIVWTLLPREGNDEGLTEEEELELSAEDLDTSFYEGEEIDLGELAREAILLALDTIPSCNEQETCTPHKILLEGGSAEAAEVEDPRWGPLRELLAKKKN